MLFHHLFWPTVIWSNNWDEGCCGLQLATSLPPSLTRSPEHTVRGAPGKGHINTRLPDDVHGQRGSLWRHPLCLNKPVHAAEGVNKARPPSLRCLNCQPGRGMAWAGAAVSSVVPQRHREAPASHSASRKPSPLRSGLRFSRGSSVAWMQ